MIRAIPTELDGAPPAVKTTALVKHYGKQVVLDGLDVAVPEGAVYLLVGPNGAGKTTTLRILLDLARADAGRAAVFGLDAAAAGPTIRSRTGYVPEGQAFGYGWMTVGRLLRHHASYHPSWDAAYAARLGHALELLPDRRFGKLSKGQVRRVQLVMALAHRPSLLVLDEPTDGLDPVMRDDVLGILAEHLADSPATVLVSTHRVYEMERLADHIGILRAGRLAAQLGADELRSRLRQYRLQLPDEWAGAPALDGVVAGRSGSGRESVWTVWGEEGVVVRELTGAGATVREVTPLTLDEAARAILKTER